MLLMGFHAKIIIYVFMTIFDDPIKLNFILNKKKLYKVPPCMNGVKSYMLAVTSNIVLTATPFNISLFVKLYCIVDSNLFI